MKKEHEVTDGEFKPIETLLSPRGFAHAFLSAIASTCRTPENDAGHDTKCDLLTAMAAAQMEQVRAAPQTPVVDPGVALARDPVLLERVKNFLRDWDRDFKSSGAPVYTEGAKNVIGIIASEVVARPQASTGRAVRPAREARAVAHDILRIIDGADVWDFPCALEGRCVGMCDAITAAIEADRAHLETPGAGALLVEAARILYGVQSYARANMVPSGEVDAWFAKYDAGEHGEMSDEACDKCGREVLTVAVTLANGKALPDGCRVAIGQKQLDEILAGAGEKVRTAEQERDAAKETLGKWMDKALRARGGLATARKALEDIGVACASRGDKDCLCPGCIVRRCLATLDTTPASSPPAEAFDTALANATKALEDMGTGRFNRDLNLKK